MLLQLIALAAGVVSSAGCNRDNRDESGTNGVTGGGGGEGGAKSDGGIGGAGGEGGVEMDAGVDADAQVDSGADAGDGGAEIVPEPVRPLMNQILPPTRAFFLWKPGSAPFGKTVTGYQHCSTLGPDDPGECPGPASPKTNSHLLDPLSAGAGYVWKVRSLYDDATFSAWSSLQTFTTDQSLIGWWRLDEGKGTTASDSSGLMNHGTLKFAEDWVDGINGKALKFGGGLKDVQIPDADALDFGTKDFTISAWIYPTQTGTPGIILGKTLFDFGETGWDLARYGDDSLAFGTQLCGWAVVGGTSPVDVWTHVAVTRTAGKMGLYVNGALEATGKCNDNLLNKGSLHISSVDPFNFEGIIDDIVLLNRSLSPEEVAYDHCTVATPLPEKCKSL